MNKPHYCKQNIKLWLLQHERNIHFAFSCSYPVSSNICPRLSICAGFCASYVHGVIRENHRIRKKCFGATVSCYYTIS